MGLIAGLTVLTLTATVVGAYSSNNRFVDLYQTKLSAQDLPAISFALDEMQIEHRVNETSDGVLVHPELKTRALAGLTLRHLPLHHIATDEKPDMSTGSMEKRAQQQRRLEADITLALRAIDGINDARVKLGIPERVYYFDKKDNTTANVVLSLRPGLTFDRERTASVVNLVAFSVPNLAPEQVSVLDTTGRDLTAQIPRDKDGLFTLGGTELEIRAREEKRLTQKVQELLSSIYPGRARLAVNLEMDFSEVEERRYAPGPPGQDVVEDSLQFVHEVLDREGTEEGGKSYDNTKKSVNYKYRENYSAMVNRTARIDRITASVCFDGANESEAAAIQNLVKGALGIDEARGDEVYVEVTPWDRPPIALPPENSGVLALDPADSELPPKNGLMILLLAQTSLILGGLGIFAFQRTRSSSSSPELSNSPNAQGTTQIVDHHLQKNGVRTSRGGATSVQNTEMLAGIVKERPESVVSLLRTTWLK